MESMIIDPSGLKNKINTKPVAKSKAVYIVPVRLKLKDNSIWPKGKYTGTSRLMRDGKEISSQTKFMYIK